MATPAEMGKDTSEVISSELDYEQRAFIHPSYRFTQCQAPAANAVITLSSSLQPVVVPIPAEPYNPSKSYITGTLTIPGVSGRYIWYHAHTWSILAHLQHYANTNSYFVDVDNLDNYMDIIMKKEMNINEFMTRDQASMFYPSNSVKNVVPALRLSAGAAPNPSSLNYREPAYFQVGALGDATTASTNPGTVTINVTLCLGDVKNTQLAMDKDFYLIQQSYMKLYINMLSKICYTSTSNVDPNLGTPTAYTKGGLANAESATITNLQILLAVEDNPDLALKCKTEFVNKTMFIPFVQSYKNPASSSSQFISLTFDAGSGHSLQKVIHAVYNNTESENTAYDHSNCASGVLTQKVQQYYTIFNSKREQDITIDCTATAPAIYSDYLQNKSQLNKSVIQNRDIYQYNWFHCSDYTNFGAEGDQEGRPNLISGKALGPIALIWKFYGSVMNNTAYQHYSYAVFNKAMTITPSRIEI